MQCDINWADRPQSKGECDSEKLVLSAVLTGMVTINKHDEDF